MSFAKLYAAQPVLTGAHIVSVEIDLSRGLHSFTVVGLPDKAVEEARDRVSAAIKNTGFKPPKSKNEKITISLAPADLKKEGPLFDVAIALAYLSSSGDIKLKSDKKIFLGELSLDGEVRPVRGVLPIIREAKKKGFEEVFVPKENVKEAGLISGISIYGVGSLKDLVEHLKENGKKISPAEQTEIRDDKQTDTMDISDIRGQESAKEGLLIAAAGGHNIAFYGPPGTGKTMLARAFAGILPPLDEEEALEVTSIHSVAGLLDKTIVSHPPFRAPHHTASYVSVVGGGANPKPGEATLAHRGVLFLDEFPEFDKRVLEALREPLEDRVVRVSRAKGFATFPAHFILIAAMNPCPCGNYGGGNKSKRCVCTPGDIARYRRKLSGPIMDRIDLWIPVGHVEYETLSGNSSGAKNPEIKMLVNAARKRQAERFTKAGAKIKLNGDISARIIDKVIPLKKEVRESLNVHARKLDLSPRAYHKTIKVAQTIADLSGADEITLGHILQAIQYRPKLNL